MMIQAKQVFLELYVFMKAEEGVLNSGWLADCSQGEGPWPANQQYLILTFVHLTSPTLRDIFANIRSGCIHLQWKILFYGF